VATWRTTCEPAEERAPARATLRLTIVLSDPERPPMSEGSVVAASSASAVAPLAAGIELLLAAERRVRQ
jgi:hypothetical protein